MWRKMRWKRKKVGWGSSSIILLAIHPYQSLAVGVDLISIRKAWSHAYLEIPKYKLLFYANDVNDSMPKAHNVKHKMINVIADIIWL